MKNIGFVMMLDISGSMTFDIDLVKIDAKAFVRSAAGRDQFGVNQFNDYASWVYPTGTNPDIVTISPFGNETEAAAAAIEAIFTSGSTDIGAAITLGNQMIKKSTADIKAFALFSDGAHNMGPGPATILGDEPPIHVAALGSWIRKEDFDGMLRKNAKSTFYNKPNAFEVMNMFNSIRADTVDGLLLANHYGPYKKGSDYRIESFVIPGDSSNNQLSVVWTNKKYRYTSGAPTDTKFNVILLDPAGKTTAHKPDIDDEGYCIFNLKNVAPGNWKCLIQYAQLGADMGGTFGAVSLDTSLKGLVEAPRLGELGQALPVRIKVQRDGARVEGVSVQASVRRPLRSLEDALKHHAQELAGVTLEEADGGQEKTAKLRALQMATPEVFAVLDQERRNFSMQPDKEGAVCGVIEHPQIPGVYDMDYQVSGVDPITKLPFTFVKNHAVLVG